MHLTLKQRKALREADRKRRLDAARARYASRNRSAKYIICFALAAICLVAAIVLISIVMKLYADYKYQTGASVLELPVVTGPCYLAIDIGYERECPDEFALYIAEGRIPQERLEVYRNEADRLLRICLDTDIVSDAYRLEIRPKDNFELKYRIALEPSYRTMRCEAELYRDKDGALWISVAGSYPRLERPISCRIAAAGERYGEILFERDIPQALSYPLDLSRLAEYAGADLSKCDRIEVSFSMDIGDSGLASPPDPVGYILDIRDAAYDGQARRSYQEANTDDYISAE